MKILTAEEFKKAEQLSFEKYFTEAELMNKAGCECFKKIVRYYGDNIVGNTVLVVCGNGKNAGDGFVIAKLLCEFGADAKIVLADKMPVIDEPLMYFNEAKNSGVEVLDFDDTDFDCTLIVDCIFGIGFHGEPKEPFNNVFDTINCSNAIVVSVDTPSGTDATNGSVSNAVKADLTIAISTLKYCHVLPPSNEYCGKVVTIDIGIPEDCYTKKYAETITKNAVKSCFSKRSVNSHKGDFGHQLNICGSYKMCGASVISAKSALKTGVGLLKCVFPKSIYPVMTSHLTQPLFSPMSENEEKTLSMGSLTHILKELSWADSVLLGCGIGNNDDTQVLTNQIIRECNVPIVLDADGINCILPNIDILREAHGDVVITPHPAEMARLINESINYVQQNRIAVAKAFANEYGAIVVLKGANTVVTNGEDVFVNTTGNAGMAMGGTGDMLAGIIGSFIAQGMDAFSSAKCAVYIHGLCGDITAKELSQRGMTVDDMLELLPALLSEFE